MKAKDRLKEEVRRKVEQHLKEQNRTTEQSGGGALKAIDTYIKTLGLAQSQRFTALAEIRRYLQATGQDRTTYGEKAQSEISHSFEGIDEAKQKAKRAKAAFEVIFYRGKR